MRWTSACAAIIAALLILASSTPAGVKTVYFDDFDGPSDVGLAGTAPDISVSGAIWEAGSHVRADGTYGDGVTGHTFTAALPFVPESGTVYEVSATVDNQGDWFAIGFLSAAPNVETRFQDNKPWLWGLVRQTGAMNWDQAFVGEGTNGGLGNAPSSNAGKLKIRVDTTSAAKWLVTWYFDEIQAFRQTVDPTTFSISYVAMGVNGLLDAATGKISRFELVEIKVFGDAADPGPADATTDVCRDTTLSWTPGEFAASHDVYFGTIFDDVSAAGRTDPRGVLLSQDRTDTTFEPGRLEFGQTYFWRVDEVNAPPDSTIFKGAVWSFTVEPRVYKVENIIATASSSVIGDGPDNTINGSGLDASDQHGIDSATMWLTVRDAQPVWIQYEFDRVYKVDQMWVWNHNSEFEKMLHFGLKDIDVQYSTDGIAWTELGDFELADAPGSPGYTHEPPINFGGVAAKYVRINAVSNWGGVQSGLSEVRFYYVPVQARLPEPVSGTQDVDVNTALTWRAGREAASQQVYLSTDRQAVADGTALVGTVNGSRYVPESLNLAQTCYWRVDEVNQAEAISTWQGDVWEFTTVSYELIDGMEDYTDEEGSRIFDAWMDGWDDTSNGSLVGYGESPFAERTIVHEGEQSMPFEYDNTDAALDSHATLTFGSARDWTQSGIATLELYFYGAASNNPDEPMWIELTDQSGKSGAVSYNQDKAAKTEASWHEWNIKLADFGVDLTKVESITIGVGGAGSPKSSGMFYFDDIRLTVSLAQP
jgi:hypothetical protein